MRELDLMQSETEAAARRALRALRNLSPSEREDASSLVRALTREARASAIEGSPRTRQAEADDLTLVPLDGAGRAR